MTKSRESMYYYGALWEELDLDSLIQTMFAPYNSRNNMIERQFAGLGGRVSGVVIPPCLEGELPPCMKAGLSKEELVEEEAEVFDAGLDMLTGYLKGHKHDGEEIDVQYIKCKSTPTPFNNKALVRKTLRMAPTKMLKLLASSQHSEEEKKQVEIIRDYMHRVQHSDRRKHGLIFFKCRRESCLRCMKNPISAESAPYFELLDRHGGYFSPIPDPQRPGKYMRFDSVSSSDKNLSFIADSHLPSFEKKSEEVEPATKKNKVEGEKTDETYPPHICAYCKKSEIGSEFRSYVFLSEADKYHHMRLFHPNFSRTEQRKLNQKKRGRPSTIGQTQTDNLQLSTKKTKLVEKSAQMKKPGKKIKIPVKSLLKKKTQAISDAKPKGKKAKQSPPMKPKSKPILSMDFFSP